ncbi:putative alpha-galactosidase [Medicago truncatula]|uniref:Putative alpha-galactosidase n=1 Tax=Medicago truncatula TaxID=3880 RepID=A0A396GNZ8_MEDTR|nr:putative alpha-galactosidase [Medicago truncatula]
MIGAKGLKGSSWPDLDMLPFGWLTDADTNGGPHRYSKLNLEEKRTYMTLWALAKSPLMYGGDMRKIDPATYEIITNPTVPEINFFNSNNIEACEPSNFFWGFPYVDSDGIRSWIATGRKGEVYLAFFNLNEQKTPVYAKTSDLAKVFPGIHISSCQGKEVWSGSVERTSQQRKE